MARRDLDDWLWQIGAELQKLSEEIGPQSPRLARSQRWEPRIDLIESDDCLFLRAEIAGISVENIRISYRSDRNSIVLRGIRHEEPFDAPAVPHHLEIHYGEFEREVRLPSLNLDSERIAAGYKNGVLAIMIPKAGRARLGILQTGTIRVIKR